MYIAIKIPQQLKFSLADEQQMFDKFEKKEGRHAGLYTKSPSCLEKFQYVIVITYSRALARFLGPIHIFAYLRGQQGHSQLRMERETETKSVQRKHVPRLERSLAILFKSLCGTRLTIELKNDTEAAGLVEDVDESMNTVLVDATTVNCHVS